MPIYGIVLLKRALKVFNGPSSIFMQIPCCIFMYIPYIQEEKNKLRTEIVKSAAYKTIFDN